MQRFGQLKWSVSQRCFTYPSGEELFGKEGTHLIKLERWLDKLFFFFLPFELATAGISPLVAQARTSPPPCGESRCAALFDSCQSQKKHLFQLKESLQCSFLFQFWCKNVNPNQASSGKLAVTISLSSSMVFMVSVAAFPSCLGLNNTKSDSKRSQSELGEMNVHDFWPEFSAVWLHFKATALKANMQTKKECLPRGSFSQATLSLSLSLQLTSS